MTLVCQDHPDQSKVFGWVAEKTEARFLSTDNFVRLCILVIFFLKVMVDKACYLRREE